MNENLIAYFDLLGYKQFIENNDEKLTALRVGHILRDIENSLSLRKTKPSNPGRVIADLEYSKVNCLNISDTIILWTSDYSDEGVENFLDVCFNLNFMLNKFTFPCRGVLISDKFQMISGKEQNSAGFSYSPNIMYGRGLLKAHIKSDSFNFASTVIDKSFVEKFADNKKVIEKIENLSLKYLVPYKEYHDNQDLEYVFKYTISNLNQTYFDNIKNGVIKNFHKDNKGVSASVQVKIDNTIDFLYQHPWE